MENTIEGKIYLDCCILVACLHSSDMHHEDVIKTLGLISRLPNVELCVSDWAIKEMKKVFVRNLGYDSSLVKKIGSRLTTRLAIRGFRFTLIPVSNKKRYSFSDFFQDIYSTLTTKEQGGKWSVEGIADAMHCIIMKNQKITYILSTDPRIGIAKDQILLKPKIIAAAI